MICPMNGEMKLAKHFSSLLGVDVHHFEVSKRDFTDCENTFCSRCPARCDYRTTHLYGCYEAVRWDRKTHLHFSPEQDPGQQSSSMGYAEALAAPASRSEFPLCPIPPSHLLSQQLIPNKHLRPQPTSLSVSAAKEPNSITFHIKTHHKKIRKQKKDAAR